MDILVQCFLNQILWLVSSQLGNLGVEEDQFQVHAGAKHKHVLMELDFGYGGRGQRVTHRHQAQILDTTVPIAVRRITGVDTGLQVPGTVDDLISGSGETGVSLRQHALHP